VVRTKGGQRRRVRKTLSALGKLRRVWWRWRSPRLCEQATWRGCWRVGADVKYRPDRRHEGFLRRLTDVAMHWRSAAH
jgi:hypothetical protein